MKNPHAKALGKLGGKAGTGKAKARTSEQARKAVDQRWKPHFKKVAYFESVFPYPLINNEWQIKWPVKGCTSKTYNPDYHCPELGCFIECVTSHCNIIEQCEKWKAAIDDGRPLRVFWWQGQEITQNFDVGVQLAYQWAKDGKHIPAPHGARMASSADARGN